MEPLEASESFAELPKEENGSRLTSQTLGNPLGDQSHCDTSQNQRNLRSTIDNWPVTSLGDPSFYLEYQDSRLSPALNLVPSNSVQNNFTEFSLLQQTDLEFAPLRASPDISVASERFQIPPRDQTCQNSSRRSLSQHPLAHVTGLSEDGASSCYSLSQHSLSPGNEGSHEDTVPSPADSDHSSSRSKDRKASRESEGQTAADPPDKLTGVVTADDTSFLTGDIPARQLLERLEKDIGMPSGSSSAVSSASETSLKKTESFRVESKSVEGARKREGPPSGAPSFVSRQPRSRMSEVSNITIRSGSTQPDDSSESLHREMLSEVEKLRGGRAGSEKEQQSGLLLERDSLTPDVGPAAVSAGKLSAPHATRADVCGTGSLFSGGYSVERGSWDRDRWSSGNQTGIDGSFLGFLPQSQSTPGVFSAPMKSSFKVPLGRLSAIESNVDSSTQSGSRTSTRSPIVMADIDASDPKVAQPGAATPHQEAHTEKVNSLPSLNYMQKVDAWRANQSSGKTSLFDNLALQGFTGVSPRQRAYDAISDSLNRMLSHQPVSAQRPTGSNGTNQLPTPSPRVALSGHSTPQRGEAVGSAPNDKDDTLATTGPSGSPLGQSQSHSSLSTVVASIQQAQQRQAEQESGLTQEAGLQQSGAVQPSPMMTLGRFSDVSFDRDTSGTLTHSQDSYNSERNQGASLAASSVVSLEVDNYAPYWSSKPSSPPLPRKPRELNIEDRIPLYLHNLGIDQSPSTILTPFAPRGPIREPEFSPTDLCTIKGSIGTPTKSAQPSEGGSPNKGEFSRCSLLSVDSSMSIPLSVDSLYPTLPFPEQVRASSSPDTAGSHGMRMALGSRPQDTSSLAASQTSQPQQRDIGSSTGQTNAQPDGGLEPSISSPTASGNKDVDSPSPHGRGVEQDKDDSFVGSKTLKEIRKLLGEADARALVGSSTAYSSSSSAGSHLHSNDDILLSLRRKTGRFQDTSFASSSNTGISRGHSSSLWARSSSDSMLTSGRLRESSIGSESVSSSGQAAFQGTQSSTSVFPLGQTPFQGTQSLTGVISPGQATFQATQSLTSLIPPGQAAFQATQSSTSVILPASDGFVVRPQGSFGSAEAESSVFLSKSARRAEPEGCSAAPPDNTGPIQLQQQQLQPPITKSTLAVSQPQPAPGTPETAGSGQLSAVRHSPATPEMTGTTEETGSTLSAQGAGSFSSPVAGDPEQGVMSDGSSESSLAVRVAKLLQSESSATVVSSRASTSDLEETRAREWIKSKLSGQQCEVLELDMEDRRRIEEIKRELLLKQPLKSQGSTDTDSSAMSSLGIPGAQLRPQPETLVAPEATEDRVSHQLQRPTAGSVDPGPQRRDLEARVQEIAVREGVTLPGAKAPRLTSITIATCRRSASPLSSPSPVAPLSPTPEPLRVNQLSTQTEEQEGGEEVRGEAGSGRVTPSDEAWTPNAVDQSPKVSHREPLGRREALGGLHRNQSGPPSHTPQAEDRTVRDSVTQVSWRGGLQDTVAAPPRGDEHATDESTNPSWGSAVAGQGGDGAAGSSAVDPPTGAGHVSHLRLTLSPNAIDLTPGATEYLPLRHSSPATSSPDEGIVLSSPLGARETVDALRRREDTSRLFKDVVPQGEVMSQFPQLFVPPHRLTDASMPLSIQTPAVPVLLPYKPHGSEELFYVPQTEAQASPTRSDSTMESSHPGSDDAVPPRFSSEVLGKLDPGLDRGITTKHTEGIYSKRLKTSTFRMQTPGHKDAVVSVNGSSQTSFSQGSHPPSLLSGALTQGSCIPGPTASTRDQGTSPVHFSHDPAGCSQEFQPERDIAGTSRLPGTHQPHDSVLQAPTEPQQQGRRDPEVAQPASRETDSTLSQLWHRFNERWTLEGGRPTRESEASLVERLERLSRLIHGTPAVSGTLGSDGGPGKGLEKKTDESVEEEGEEGGGGAKGKVDRGRTGPRQAWLPETPYPAEDDGLASIASTPPFSSASSQHLFPAERDSASETGGSVSTVDTARLVRAFGADRVRCLKTGESLSRLYSAIDQQREGMERRSRKERTKEPPRPTAGTETSSTDDSLVAPDSSTSTCSHRGPSQLLAAKKGIKLANKSIQAGDLEIVSNGTRRHTRDVGTTFPSPGEARAPRKSSSSSSSSSRTRRSPSNCNATPKERKSKKGQRVRYPEGISWFVPAEELKAEVQKENDPEEEWVPKPTAWFQPCSRVPPWREPLRQRHVQEDRQPTIPTGPDPESREKTTSSGLVCMSLQEALAVHRPEFVSQSRERIKRLAVQAEERRLQTVFSRQRDELFDRPGGPGRLPRPAGTAHIRRAVPRKEMIERSKRRSGERGQSSGYRKIATEGRRKGIWEKLPEVQRRREEEKRQAEYQSYRLNAQLYNKRITNTVLGRRTPWQ